VEAERAESNADKRDARIHIMAANLILLI